MKNKLFIFIGVILSVALVSCSKTPARILDGGPTFGGIYFLTNNNVLIEAHESVLNVPATKGFTDLEIVSYGLERIEKLGGDSNISLEKRFSLPASESELFNVETSEQIKRYKQIVRVVYSANTSSKNRSATFRLYSNGGNGHAADITFEQNGR